MRMCIPEFEKRSGVVKKNLLLRKNRVAPFPLLGMHKSVTEHPAERTMIGRPPAVTLLAASQPPRTRERLSARRLESLDSL
jgi:hypothetical protein